MSKSLWDLLPCEIYSLIGFTAETTAATFLYASADMSDMFVALGLTNPGEIGGPKPKSWLKFSCPNLEPFWGALPVDEF